MEENLFIYYKNNFELKQYGNFSITEIEDMIPYEREIYLALLTEKIHKENEARDKARQQKQRH